MLVHPLVDSGTLLIRAGLLIDGAGASLRNAEILIREGRIAEVGPADSIARPPDPAATIDALGSTVLPGLIDCHHHVGYAGHVGMQELEWPNSLEYTAIVAGANATRALLCGVTSALDVGCRGRIAVAARRAIEDGTVRGPRMRVSGQIITTVGGPLDAWPSTMRIDPDTRLTTLVSGVEEIRRTIRGQYKDGVDNVKLQISGSTVQARRGGRASVFTDDELRAATDSAHDLGLSAAAHAEGPEAISAAIKAGFDTVQHASFIDDPTIDLLERHPNSRLVFTLAVYDDIRVFGPRIGYPADGLARVETVWQDMVASVRLAYERGVPFAVGSDAGGKVHPHGRYAHDAVLLATACGIPADRAIRAATEHAAKAAWLSNVGRVAAGYEADLLIVAGDLSRAIAALEDETKVTTVIQRGRIVKSDRSVGRFPAPIAAGA